MRIPEDYPFDLPYHLPPAELSKLVKARFKLKCQAMPRIDAYEPLPLQYLFHKSIAKERCAFGGNQSGKTTATTWHCAVWVTGRYPSWFPSKGKMFKSDAFKVRLIGHDLKDIVENVIVPALDFWFEDIDPIKWIRRHQSIVRGETKSGSAVFFTAAEKQPMRHHEGWTGDIILVDEPISESYYNASLRGILKTKGRALLSMTPLDCDWADERFVPRDDLTGDRYDEPFAVALDATENLYVDYEEREYWQTQLAKRDHREYLRRVKGLSPKVLDKALVTYSREENVISPFKIDKASYYMAIDPHGQKGDAIIWLAALPPIAGYQTPYIVIFERFEPEQYWTLKELVNYIKVTEKSLGISDKIAGRFIDPRYCKHRQKASGYTLAEEMTRISILNDYPMTFIPAAVEPVATGLARLTHLFSEDVLVFKDGKPTFQKQLSIYSTCPRTIEACDRARLIAATKQVDDRYKDLVDCLRYVTATSPPYLGTDKSDVQISPYLTLDVL